MSKPNERRRYFRIEDELIVAWRRVDFDEKDEKCEALLAGGVAESDITRHYLKLESDITALVSRLSVKQPEMAHIMGLFNQKLNIIAQNTPMGQTHEMILKDQKHPVNLSACGMAFTVEENMAKGSCLQIEMMLFPRKIYILCYALVIACEKSMSVNKQRPYFVSVDFIAMRPEDTDKLIEHIMQKDLKMLQLNKKRALK